MFIYWRKRKGISHDDVIEVILERRHITRMLRVLVVLSREFWVRKEEETRKKRGLYISLLKEKES